MVYTAPPSAPDAPTVAADMLEGAGQLAHFLFGEDTRATRRRVYRLSSEVGPADRPPFFTLGDRILRGRRSRLEKWIDAREG